jgi:hypothetical protein
VSKYRAKPTTVDGIRFASKHEAGEYQKLKALELGRKIRDLRLQVRYPMHVNGELVCVYVADFTFWRVDTGEFVVADAKGYATAIYKLKKKLMRAVYGIEIVEL